MPKLTEREFVRLVKFVREKFGINLEKKRELIEARLSYDINTRGFHSYTQYLDCVTGDPLGKECQNMIDRLSTNYTFFFRESTCLQHLKKVVVPELLQRGEKTIRIWSAAASSGQECYTIAMVMEDALALQAEGVTYSILGTDINGQMLEMAQRGVYPVAESKNIPQTYQRRYCRTVDAEHFEITEKLRNHIRWKRQNLMESFCIAQPFHVVFCRNVMFYFAPETRALLIGSLGDAVRPGGYLYIGTTESLAAQSKLFRYVAPSIYRKGGAGLG